MTDEAFNRIWANIQEAIKVSSLKMKLKHIAYQGANREFVNVKPVPDELKIMCSN